MTENPTRADGPDHDWMMPHDFSGKSRSPMDSRGCPPNCPNRLHREAAAHNDSAMHYINEVGQCLTCQAWIEVDRLRADLADAQRVIAAVERLIDPATQMARRPFNDCTRWFEELDIREALSAGDGRDAAEAKLSAVERLCDARPQTIRSEQIRAALAGGGTSGGE